MVAKKFPGCLKPSITDATQLPIEPVIGVDTLNTLRVEMDNSLGQIPHFLATKTVFLFFLL